MEISHSLERNMAPPECEGPEPGSASSRVDDTEETIIANAVTALRNTVFASSHKFELCLGRFGDHELHALLTKCDKLAPLDIQVCRNLELEGALKGNCQQLTVTCRLDYDEDEVLSDSGDELIFLGFYIIDGYML